MKNWDGCEVYIFYFSDCFKQQNSPKNIFKNTLNLNCQNEYMINIKCVNKNKTDFFSNILARKIAPKMFSLFISNQKSVCLYFIGADGDENLKK